MNERLRELLVHYVVLDERELQLVTVALKEMRDQWKGINVRTKELDTLLTKLKGDYEEDIKEDLDRSSDDLSGSSSVFERRSITSTPATNNQTDRRSKT